MYRETQSRAGLHPSRPESRRFNAVADRLSDADRAPREPRENLRHSTRCFASRRIFPHSDSTWPRSREVIKASKKCRRRLHAKWYSRTRPALSLGSISQGTLCMPSPINPPTPGCYLISSILVGPSPVLGSIFQGHALEWNGTAGGKKTSIPSFLSSTSIALRASPPINS
jgi:hypothetical protein